jgi:hypothetical protein
MDEDADYISSAASPLCRSPVAHLLDPPAAAGTTVTETITWNATLGATPVCVVTLTVTKGPVQEHIVDTNPANDSLTVQVILCSDEDDDGVADPAAGSANQACSPADNCPTVANPSQLIDSDGDAWRSLRRHRTMTSLSFPANRSVPGRSTYPIP